MVESPSPRAAVRSRWSFFGAVTLPRTERVDRFHGLLLEALRVAAGVPTDFELTWSSGAHGAVGLESDEAPTRRWIELVLAPSYPTGCWRSERPGSRGSGRVASFGRPLAGVEHPFRVVDIGQPPWSDAVLTSLRLLGPGVSVRWRLRPLGGPAPRPADTPLVAQPVGTRTPAPPGPVRDRQDATAARAVAPLWDVRATVTAPTDDARRLAERVVSAGARQDGGNGFRWRRSGRWLGHRPPSIVLSLPEVAALFPSPSLRSFGASDVVAPGLRTVPLGRSAGGRSIGLPVEPLEGRHALFLGETGMGKSTALLRALLAALPRGGVILFDPVGDTGRRLIDRVPEEALARLVWVSPSVSPVGVNALAAAGQPGPSGDRALTDVVQALRRVRAGRYADSPFWGPRVEEMVFLALRAASRYPHGTFREAGELLRRAASGPRGVPPEAAEAVELLCERVRARPDEVDGARRALDEVVRVPILARMLASPDAEFSVAGAARDGRVVVVSGDAPEVGESVARTLLSVHLALAWSELVARRPRTKVFVAADELAWYANEAAAEMWRLGRRFNLHLWATTQSLATLPEPVRDAAVTNTADVVAFRGSPDDARELSRWSAELPVEATLRLGRGEAAVLVGKGSGPVWMRVGYGAEPSRPDRWRRVWEQCRPLWGEATSAPNGPPEEPATADERARTLLLTVWSGLLLAGEAAEVRVNLTDLRAEVDPEGAQVRELGQRLAAAGGLTSVESPEGRVWCVRREAVARLLDGGVDAAELAAADARWRAVLARRPGVGPTKRL